MLHNKNIICQKFSRKKLYCHRWWIDFFLASDNLANFQDNKIRNFPISVISNTKNDKKIYTVVGSAPTTSDKLAIDIELEDIEEDAFLCFHKTGAYGLTASLGHFLGRGYPCELGLFKNDIKLMRKRDISTDFIAAYRNINS